jgi:hypothetical protein
MEGKDEGRKEGYGRIWKDMERRTWKEGHGRKEERKDILKEERTDIEERILKKGC